jgi:VanZ family protein
MKRPIFLIVTLLVIVITLIPLPKKIQNKALGWDKLIHFSIFGLLGFFAQASISLFSLLYGGFLATVTELLQKFIPGRAPDIVDFSTNIIGVVIGSSLWELVRRTKG